MNITTLAKRAGSAMKFFWQTKHPTIIFVGGLIAGGLCLYETIKASTEVKPIMEKHIEEFEHIKEAMLEPERFENSDPENLKNAKNKEILMTAKDLGKLYFKAIIWGGISIALLTTGHLLECKKAAENAALAAATAASLNVVDSNLRKMFGETGVNMFHDREFDADQVREIMVGDDKDAQGHCVKQYSSVPQEGQESRKLPEDFNTFVYDSSSVEPNFFFKSPVDAVLQLTMIQNTLNAKLNSGAVVGLTLNDALEAVGFCRSAMPAYGQFTGWVEGDYISFGLETYTDIIGARNAGGDLMELKEMIENVNNEGLYLRLNPTGPVGDRIFNNKFKRRVTVA